ncbi:BON domain-containing protein [Methylomonas sp. HW2-6]|uniref:BON domain-containing protein n=1 Tax=Methylomonas sp. HW2-6 TaxID=3376687 RepID=UPI004042690F
MKIIKRHVQKKLSILGYLFVALGITACQPDGQTEKAGQKIDKAVDTTGQAIEQTADKAGQQLGAAKDSVAQQAETTGEYLDKSAQNAKAALDEAGTQIDQAIGKTEKQMAVAKDSVTDTANATGGYLDDAIISAKIKTKLLSDDFLKLAPIEVTTVNGVVTLRGTVDSEQLVGRAIGLVNSQEHVKSVQNELLVKASVPSKQ